MFAVCDESGIHAKSGWWAFGVVWLPDDADLGRFEQESTDLRRRDRCWGEFKWEGLSERYLPTYSEFVRLGLNLPDLRFTGMVVDTNLLTPDEMKKFHAGDKQLAYVKYMRKLIQRRVSYMTGDGHRKFTLLWDKQPVSRELSLEFRKICVNDMRSLAAERKIQCEYLHLSSIDSRILHLLQLADMLTAALWSAWQGGTPGGQEKARLSIQGQIEAWAGCRLNAETTPWRKPMNVWQMKPGS